MIPTLIASSAFPTSSRARLPFSISSFDIHGLAACKTFGSQSYSAAATLSLRSPDQLMKTLYVSAMTHTSASRPENTTPTRPVSNARYSPRRNSEIVDRINYKYTIAEIYKGECQWERRESNGRFLGQPLSK